MKLDSTNDLRCIAEIHYKLGLNYLMLGSYDEAVNALKEATRALDCEMDSLKEKDPQTDKIVKKIKELEELQEEIGIKIQEIEETKEEVNEKDLPKNVIKQKLGLF